MFDTLTPIALAGSTCPQPLSPRTASPKLLVFAPDSEPGAEPRVFLADSESQTEEERLFTCDEDVVRLPRSASVAVRPVHHSTSPSGDPAAERSLLEAVVAGRRNRAAAVAVPGSVPAQRTGDRPQGEAEFAAALRRGDSSTAYAFALVLQRAAGLEAVYEVMRLSLEEVGDEWALGRATVLHEHTMTSAASTVVERLRGQTPSPACTSGIVVLASPVNDRHLLGMPVLAHLLEQAGHDVLVAGDLPHGELVSLAARPTTRAVVLSVHNAVPAAAMHSLVADLRAAAGAVKIAVGGPGLPSTAAFGRSCGADLVSSDPAALLRLLVAGDPCALTARESEVLRAVADGLTNTEIAGRLWIAPATVKSHLDSVLNKTGTEHRAAAVAHALRSGWIS